MHAARPCASGWITVQGRGRIGKLPLQTPAMIHFGQETEDEVFITAEAATAGVEIENTGSEPLVGLRYFGPDTYPSLPKIGDFKKNSPVAAFARMRRMKARILANAAIKNFIWPIRGNLRHRPGLLK